MADEQEWDLNLSSERVFPVQCPGNITAYERLTKRENVHGIRLQSWPPRNQFFNQIRERVFRVLRESQYSRGTRVERYRGAMDIGVDARRTLVGMFRGEPFIYVKTFAYRGKRPVRPVIDSREPVVWIFQPLLECSNSQIEWHHVAPWIENSFCSDCTAVWYAEDLEFGRSYGLSLVERKVVRLARYLGMVTFTRWGTNDNRILAEYGGENSSLRRVPRVGHAHQPQARTWWEKLISLAAHYADKSVYCVTLDETGAYGELACRSSVDGKQFTVLRGSVIGNNDVLKLSAEFWVNRGYLQGSRDEINPKLVSIYSDVIRFLEQQYPPTYRVFTAD